MRLKRSRGKTVGASNESNLPHTGRRPHKHATKAQPSVVVTHRATVQLTQQRPSRSFVRVQAAALCHALR